jgi:uncharacterized metal-binding protein YceD (DUF177 family)
MKIQSATAIQPSFLLMKKSSNPYLIPFAGLKNGEHKFDYVIEDAFFTAWKNSEIQHARIHTQVILTKEINLLVFDVKMEGTINVLCDRCGDPFDFPVWGERKLIVSLTNDKFDDGDDIVSLSLDAYEIDISQTLYEYITLLLPQRRIHPVKEDGTSGCNENALKILNKLSTKEEEQKTDPRWDALKKIKQN